MTNIALVPQRDVLQCRNRVSPDDACQTTQPLARDRISFMRHGGTAFLPFSEKFFHFENFRALKMTKLGCPAIDA